MCQWADILISMIPTIFLSVHPITHHKQKVGVGQMLKCAKSRSTNQEALMLTTFIGFENKQTYWPMDYSGTATRYLMFEHQALKMT